MRTLKIFGWLSHFLTVAIFLFGIIFFLATKSSFRYDDYSEWTLLINGDEFIDEKDIIIKSFFILIWILYILYFVAIFLFNLSVRNFEKRDFYNNKHSKRFNWIGLIFIFNYSVALILSNYIIIQRPDDVIDKSLPFSEIAFNQLQSPLGGLIIGFFFLVLSQVFKEAKKQKEENIELKQENELTI